MILGCWEKTLETFQVEAALLISIPVKEQLFMCFALHVGEESLL